MVHDFHKIEILFNEDTTEIYVTVYDLCFSKLFHTPTE